jgi:hypothetical protein
MQTQYQFLLFSWELENNLFMGAPHTVFWFLDGAAAADLYSVRVLGGLQLLNCSVARRVPRTTRILVWVYFQDSSEKLRWIIILLWYKTRRYFP